jgi:glycosyltransferase involved in cell wall biosynthesis
MRILFYAPFKPIDHPDPSGDTVIGRGLFDYLAARGCRVRVASEFRSRWAYRRPRLWPRLAAEYRRAGRLAEAFRPDLWLTYHTYYKGPDLIGPGVCRRTKTPYVIFQAAYATKYKKRLLTLPGFWFNREALIRADHVFTNRRLDYQNLERVVPSRRLTYVRPGLYPSEFFYDPQARARLRAEWKAADRPVAVTAAMFRPGVKTKGLTWQINVSARLLADGLDHTLVVIGDGPTAGRVQDLGRRELGDRVVFTGRVERSRMREYYSAGDAFAFPGFRESLGMVYLEAQSCGLPVVALRNGGVPEVVAHGQTGLLAPYADFDGLADGLALLLTNPGLRRRMGRNAAERVRMSHDLDQNYGRVIDRLKLVSEASAHDRG